MRPTIHRSFSTTIYLLSTKNYMTITNITPTVRYIGVDDLTIDLFENQYPVPNGMSYNSYLLLDESVAIVDTVDRRYIDTWLSNLEAQLDGRTPSYLIVEHLEPDHSAGIAAICTRYPQLRLVMSAFGTFRVMVVLTHKFTA
jgi:flavorubredoxin